MTPNPYPGWQLDPDPLTPPEEASPPPPREARRLGCLSVVLVALVVVGVWL